MAKEKPEIEAEEGNPVCEKCGNAKMMENGEWVCPHCDGEIDFFGDEEDAEDN